MISSCCKRLIGWLHIVLAFKSVTTQWSPWNYYRSFDIDERAAQTRCIAVGDTFVNPTSCGNYFNCILSPNGRLTAKPQACTPSGYKFDDTLKMCVNLFGECPNEPSIFPHINLCTAPDQKFAFPDDCSRYFRCHLYSNGLFYAEKKQCSGSQNFDEFGQQCVDGDCPQDLVPLPDSTGWVCEFEGAFSVIPTDCSKYYKCTSCSKSTNTWCYTAFSCGEGEFFDIVFGSCVDSPICPQELLELPGGPGWHCENHGDHNVNPEDCGGYYQCVECSKDSGWCYVPFTCPAGQLFNDGSKECVSTDLCPQDYKPVPPSWTKCKFEGEQISLPDNCYKYYKCIPCSHPGGWCYEQFDCPNGYVFDDYIDKCEDRKWYSLSKRNKVGFCPRDLKPFRSGETCKRQSWGSHEWGDKNDCRVYWTCHNCHSHGRCKLRRPCSIFGSYYGIWDPNDTVCLPFSNYVGFNPRRKHCPWD